MKTCMKIALLTVSTLLLILNLAGASEYAFGTKVNATDNDIGKPLFAMPATTTIAYWDTGLVPGYDDTDVVYLHVSGPSVIANDVRLTPFGSFAAGSKVTPYDNDIGMPLTGFGPGGFSIRYLNLYGSASYDLEDPVYVHQTVPPLGAFVIVTNDVRLTQVPGFEQGTKVHDFEPDHNKVLGITPPTLGPVGFFDVNGNGLYDAPDDLYLNYPSGVPKIVSANNVRLSGPSE